MKKRHKIDLSHIPERPGVYRVCNTLNGDSYIGSSRDMHARCYGHWGTLRMGRINRVGRTNALIDSNVETGSKFAFQFEMIEECPIENLNEREQYWIDTLGPTLNLNKVGNRDRRPQTDEPLDHQINIPCSTSFKRRLIRCARQAEGRPSMTMYARILLERAVEQEEQSRAAEAVKS